MKKLFAIALSLFAAQAFAASLFVGAGALTGSVSGSSGASGALTAQNGAGLGIAAAHNDTTNTGAVLTGSQTSIGPGFTVNTVGGTVSQNQTVTNSVGFHAQTGGIGAAGAGGLGGGLTGGGSFSGFVLTLP